MILSLLRLSHISTDRLLQCNLNKSSLIMCRASSDFELFNFLTYFNWLEVTDLFDFICVFCLVIKRPLKRGRLLVSPLVFSQPPPPPLPPHYRLP